MSDAPAPPRSPSGPSEAAARSPAPRPSDTAAPSPAPSSGPRSPGAPVPDRRGFLRAAGRVTAGLLALGGAAWAPAPLAAAFRAPRTARGPGSAARPGSTLPVLQEEPWGRIEALADGAWALVSTPREDATTLSNGGIVAGRDGVLLVEGLGSERGLLWMARRARALTGRWPDHVVVTHYHGDHTAGLAALDGNEEGWRAEVHMSAETRRRTLEAAGDASGPLERVLAAARELPGAGSVEVDLGGRRVRVDSLDGHTTHDVTVTLEEEGIVFCGDLVWNAFFPNYVDALPTRLSRSVDRIAAGEGSTFVPGHGPLAGREALDHYRALLSAVADHAARAAREGWTAEEAAGRLVLPAPVDGWFRFSPRYPARAIQAWMDESAGRG